MANSIPVILTAAALLLVMAAPALPQESSSGVPVYGYQVVGTYPHDRQAFTQGLIFQDGVLYESTGLYGRSSLRRVDLESGEVLLAVILPPYLFGEGITLWQGKIIQLTWQSHLGLIYDNQTLQFLESFAYPTEGWGITSDASRLIMSDGSSNLYFLDPATFRRLEVLPVRADGAPLTGLNELEYVKGLIYANIYYTDKIAIISPQSGNVTAWLDLQGLWVEGRSPDDVLNGIAYDPDGDRLLVTGKLWPQLYEIELTA
ncbi:MAG: glutaminyl-peptide cyclotransferase [Methanosarcinales archaeon]|nr:glutaminyl-peptide cyclotransferase [Methanosarcinales archaeon]